MSWAGDRDRSAAAHHGRPDHDGRALMNLTFGDDASAALVTDRYLESLLSVRESGGVDAPSDADLDPMVRAVAVPLADGAAVLRIHPSFRFEEWLARRLDEFAARLAVAGETAGARPAHGSIAAIEWPLPAPDLDRIADPGHDRSDQLGSLDPARALAAMASGRRPLLIGGTLASAALSIAGAAIVAWRRGRIADGPLGPSVGRAADQAEPVRLA